MPKAQKKSNKPQEEETEEVMPHTVENLQKLEELMPPAEIPRGMDVAC